MGNFSGSEAVQLLGALRRAAGERCQLLLGTDMWKDVGVLLRAYHDGQGKQTGSVWGGWKGMGLQSLSACGMQFDEAALGYSYARSLLNPPPCFRLHQAGVSSAFILNGMRHALGTLGHPAAADAAAGLFDYELGVNAERQQVGWRSMMDVWAGRTVSSPPPLTWRCAHKRCVLSR